MWLSTYHGLRQFETAGQLESDFGKRIRSEKPPDVDSAHQRLTWVSKQYAIRVSLRVAQNWMTAKSKLCIYSRCIQRRSIGLKLILRCYDEKMSPIINIAVFGYVGQGLLQLVGCVPRTIWRCIRLLETIPRNYV